MAKLESAAILAVIGVLAFIYLKLKPATDTITNTITGFSKTFESFKESVHDTITFDRSREVIYQNQDALNPNGFLQKQTRLKPFGTSILDNWVTDRRIQLNQPYDTMSVWGDINRMHSQTVPVNIGMLGNIQMGNTSYFDNIRSYVGVYGTQGRIFTPKNPDRFVSRGESISIGGMGKTTKISNDLTGFRNEGKKDIRVIPA